MVSTVKIGMQVSDNGDLRNLTKEAKALNGELTAAQKAAKSIGKGMASGSMGPSKEENIAYRNARGVAGTGGGGSRDFAKQAQGLGGLVRLYATFAANIFAVTAAFTALDNAMQYTQMIKGAEVLEASTGAALRNIAKDMQAVSDNALSMKDSLKFAALASSAGISQKSILELTRGAKGAALALGRDLGDAIDRVIRGVTKLEPELLDELGVTVKAQQAYRAYAASIGVSVEALTGYQKSAAYTIAVTEELTRKYGDVADKVEASPFNKFVGELKNVGTSLLNLVNNVVTPVVSILANNTELVYAGILFTVKALASKALPEINKLFTVSPSVLAERKSQVNGLIEDLKASNKTQKALLLKQADEEVAIQADKIARLKNIEAARIRQLAPQAFKNPNGQSARFLSELGSVSELDRDTKLKATITAGLNRETKAVAEMTKAKEAGLAVDEKVLASALTRKTYLTEINEIVKKHPETLAKLVTEEKTLNSLQQSRSIAAEASTQAILRQGKASQAEIDLAKTKVSLAKLSRDEAAQTAKYLEGTAASQLAYSTKQIEVDAARLELQKQLGRVQTTNTTVVRMGANGFPTMVQESVDKVNMLGKASMRFGSIMDGVVALASRGAVALSAALGWIGLAATAIYILYAAIKSGLNYFGLLNKYSGELNKTLDEATGILDVATTSFSKYSKNLEAAKYSISATMDANSMAANTFDQVTDSIERQITAFQTWQENQTAISAWWDTAFGTSNFDKLKNNVSAQISAASKFMKADSDKQLLASMSAGVQNASVPEELLAIQQKLTPVMAAASDAVKRENDSFKDLTDSLKDAEVASSEFNKQQDIKNEKIRKTVGFLETLAKEKNINVQLKILAEFDETKGFFKGLPKELQSIIKLQQEIMAQEKELADIKMKEAIADAKIAQLTVETTTFEDIVYKFIESLTATITKSIIVSFNRLLDRLGAWAESFGQRLLNNVLKFTKIIEEKGWTEAIVRAVKFLVTGLVNAIINTISNAIPGLNALIKAGKAVSSGISKGAEAAAKEGSSTAPRAPSKTEQLASSKAEKEALAAKGKALEKTIKLNKENGILEQANIKSAAEAASASERAKDKAASQSGKRSRELAFRKEVLKAELEYLTATAKLLSSNAKEDERRLGYVTGATLEAQKQNTFEQISVREQQQKLDIEEKYKRAISDSTMNASEAGVLKEKALKNLKLEVETEKEVARYAFEISAEQAKKLQYQEDIAKPLERELSLQKEILGAKKATGAVTPIEAIKRQFDIERQLNENTLNAAKAGAREDSIALRNAQASYDLADKKLTLEEKLAVLAQINADREQVIATKLELSTMYLDDLVEMNYRYADSAKGFLTIQTDITNEYQNQVEKILQKNNPATQALEIEKATLDYITKQSDAYDKIHEARKRQLSETGKTADGTSQRQVAYDEARRLEDEFRKSLPDYISFIFNEIYAGMDAAIETFVDKLFTGQKIYFKDLISTFDKIVQEESRKMIADQIKLFARSLVTKIFGGEGVKTKEERLEDYSKTAAESAKKALEYHSASLDYLENIDVNIARFTEGTAAAVAKPGENPTDPKSIEKTVLDKATDWIKDKVLGIFKGGISDDDSKAGTFTGTDGVPQGGLTSAENLPPLLEETTVSFFTKIKDSFGSLGDFMSEGLSGIFGSEGIFGTLLGGMGDGLSSVFGQLGSMISGLFSGTGGGGGGDFLSSAMQIASSFLFAGGGIMSEYGPLKLNKYAAGGVANSPQMAIFGEGTKPEAYVPLNDGRNIPVKMVENNTKERTQVVNVTNNFTVQGTTSRETQQEVARKVGVSINRSLQRNG